MKKKMYKKGKFWVVASITATSVLATTVAQAEETQTDTTGDTHKAIQTNTSVSDSTETEKNNTATVEITTPTTPVLADEKQEEKNDPQNQSATTKAESDTQVQESNTVSNKTSEIKRPSIPEIQPSTTFPEIAQPHNSAASAGANDQVHRTTDVIVDSKGIKFQYLGKLQPNDRLKFAFWSEKDGGDDLTWYDADATNAAYADFRKHRDYGKYYIHTYVERAGRMIGLAGEDFIVPEPAAVIKVENINHTNGTYDVVVSNIVAPRGIKEVSIPSWSEKNRGDDLIWHKAQKINETTYKFTVKASEHKGDRGLYNSHVYIVENDGKLVGVGGITATLNEVPNQKTAATIKVENINHTNGTYDVVVSNIVAPRGIKEVSIPSWSEKNRGDDLIWHKAQKINETTYKFTVKASEHKGDRGLYNSHVYIVENDGKLVGVGGVTATLNEVPNQKTAATIKVENINHTNGTYDVVVSNIVAPRGIKEVSIPSWSEKNRGDDLIWHKAQKINETTYKFTVKASEHNWDSGLYNSHVYIVENDGKLVGVGGVTATLNIPVSSIKSTININYRGTGNYEVKISSAPQTGEIVYAVWSDKNGGDDLRWYTATKIGTSTYLGNFNAQNHKDNGKYFVDVYQKSNGTMNYLTGTNLNVNRSQYDAPYFSQRDGRWAGLVYGRGNIDVTGCVPTTLAMAISALKNDTITPNTVADYLYHHTNSFNKFFTGTSGRGIVEAARNWGLDTTVLRNESELSKTLAEGYYVTAAVGGGNFSSGFVTHEILLKGNSNGRTYVMDPYNANNNGWYSISYLHSIKSQDIDDNSEGSPFMKITDR